MVYILDFPCNTNVSSIFINIPEGGEQNGVLFAVAVPATAVGLLVLPRVLPEPGKRRHNRRPLRKSAAAGDN